MKITIRKKIKSRIKITIRTGRAERERQSYS